MKIYLFYVGWEDAILLFSARDKRQLHHRKFSGKFISCVSSSPKFVFIGFDDGSVTQIPVEDFANNDFRLAVTVRLAITEKSPEKSREKSPVVAVVAANETLLVGKETSYLAHPYQPLSRIVSSLYIPKFGIKIFPVFESDFSCRSVQYT